MSLNAKGLKVVFWNIQSQYSKHVFVTDFIESNNIDVMVLNETWLREDITDNFINIRNYSLYRQDRAEMTSFNTTKRGGGIAIYIKNTIQYVVMDSNVFCYNTKDIESCCIKLIFERIRPIYIVAVYRPPSGSVHNFGKALVDTLDNLPATRNFDLFMGGDFNIDYEIPSPERTILKDIEKRFGLTQQIKKPTRPLYSNSIIDHIFTNNKDIITTGLADVNISDHVPIFLVRKKARSKPLKTEFTGRTYKNYDKEKFKKQLEEIDWTGFYSCWNPNGSWDILYANILNLVNKMCPIVTSKYNKSRPPWLTRELIELGIGKKPSH